MTDEQIELCLKRLSMGKTSDVMNFSYADTLAYIERLKEENASLCARLEKAVELPRIIHPNPTEWHIQYQYESGVIAYDIRYSETKAQARLAELKGEEK